MTALITVFDTQVRKELLEVTTNAKAPLAPVGICLARVSRTLPE